LPLLPIDGEVVICGVVLISKFRTFVQLRARADTVSSKTGDPMSANGQLGLAAMSAARPLFHRKRKSMRDVAMSHKCRLGCKTIFTTKLSNIDSRTNTGAQRRFKTRFSWIR
jgi:hypothetical protein